MRILGFSLSALILLTGVVAGVQINLWAPGLGVVVSFIFGCFAGWLCFLAWDYRP